MDIIDNLIKILREKHLSMADLTKFLELSSSTTSNWKTKHRNPPSEYILRICEFLNISPDELLSGNKKTSSSQSSEDEEKILELYRVLDEEGRIAVLNTAYKEKRRMAEERKDTEEMDV
jgi:transcriptional regulator with XRE-family HTH domain